MLVLEDVVASVWSPIWATSVFYVALVLVLSFRPRGLFGRVADV
jgi:branched-subunit amino acid ABC-type transport system permease component